MKKSTFDNGLIYLSQKDTIIRNIIQNITIIKPKKRSLDFSMFVSVIINQQLSGKAANTIKSRVQDLCEGSINIDNFNKLSDKSLLQIGVSRSKISYIRNISQYLSTNTEFINELKSMDLNNLTNTLCKFKGIGLWSSNIIALFYLGHPNVFPVGDGTLNKAITKLYKNEITIEEIIENWSPYKSIASIVLWQWVDNGMKDFL